VGKVGEAVRVVRRLLGALQAAGRRASSWEGSPAAEPLQADAVGPQRWVPLCRNSCSSAATAGQPAHALLFPPPPPPSLLA
jgi:hypothetical protein